MTPIEGTPCERPVSGVHWKPSRDVIEMIVNDLWDEYAKDKSETGEKLSALISYEV